MKKIISGIMELNLPNKLTLLRMALVPVYLVLLAYGLNVAALIVFAIASITDALEKKRGNRYVGRSEFEAPETDGNIYFGSEEQCEIGTFVNVKITGAKAYDLMGERV